MVDRGGTTQRLASALVVVALTTSGCAGASSSASSSPSGGSVAPSASSTASSTGNGVPSGSPITDQSASFRFLPDSRPGLVPAMTCDGPIGANDPVAVVQLQASTPNSGPVVLRDYADIANPRTVCTFTGGQVVQILDAQHLIMAFDPEYAVVDVPDVQVHHVFKLPVTPGSQYLAAVSPALDQLAWVAENPPFQPGATAGTDTIHITTATGDNRIETVVDNNTGRCGQPDDSNFGAYTRAGAHLYVLDQPLESESSLIVMEGLTKVFSAIPPAGDWPDGGNPAMALWSPTSETLYYRQGKDVWKLSVGSDPVRFLTNTVWYYPTFSPDGTHLAYALMRSDGFHDSYIVDLAHGGAPKLIGAGLRNLPVFLNNTQLWFRAEGPGEACGYSGVGPRLYNVVSGVESSTIIESVYKVWPATSSNW